MADYETIRIDEQPADDDGGETSALSQAEVEERKLTKLLEGHFPWHSHSCGTAATESHYT